MDLDLAVVGCACFIHRNDWEAAHVEQGSHLLLWNGDAARNLLIDKYDVRSHFSVYADMDMEGLGVESAGDVIDSIDVSAGRFEKELDKERYHDLENQSDMKSNSGYLSVIHASDGTASLDRSAPAPPREEAQEVHLQFSVPDGISVPRSRQQLDVLLHTALKTRKSAQLEIFLKLRQSGNPLFDFLNAGSRCHDFYQFIKRLPDDAFWRILLTGGGSAAAEGPGGERQSAARDALSFIQDYSSSSSDDSDGGDEVAPAAEDTIGVMGIEDILQQGPAVALNEEDDKLRTQIRANRLQRAKQMAAHFQQVVDGSLNTENLKLSAELGDNSINSDGRGDILAEPVTVQKSIVYNSSSESHCSEETFCHRHSRLKNQRHHGKKRKRRRFCSSKKGSPSRSSDSSSGSHRKSFSRSRSRSASPNYLRRRTRQRECRGDSSCSSVSSPVLVADTVRPLLTLQQKIAQALAKENLSLL